MTSRYAPTIISARATGPRPIRLLLALTGVAALSLAWVGVAHAAPPGPPEGVSAVAYGQGAILIQWQPPTDDGGSPITGYRALAASPGPAPDGTCQTDGSGTQCIVAGLEPAAPASAIYTVAVWAANADGEDARNPGTSSQSLRPGGEYDAPSISAVAPGPGSLEVAWDDVSRTDAPTLATWTAEATEVGSSTPTQTCQAPEDQTTCTVSGLAPGTAYEVRVHYTDQFDIDSPPSSPVTETPLAGNLAPTANPDQASTTAGTPVEVDVLANDADPDGDALSVTGVANPGNGTAEVGPDDTITYTPADDFIGTDTFEYTVDDGGADPLPQAAATATVTITVTAAPGTDNPPQNPNEPGHGGADDPQQESGAKTVTKADALGGNGGDLPRTGPSESIAQLGLALVFSGAALTWLSRRTPSASLL